MTAQLTTATKLQQQAYYVHNHEIKTQSPICTQSIGSAKCQMMNKLCWQETQKKFRASGVLRWEGA